MIYPHDFEAKTGFEPLRGILKGLTVSPMGASMVEQMHFSSDFHIVSHRLHTTDEMASLIRRAVDLPIDNFHDMREALGAIRPHGSYMPTDSLYKLMQFMKALQAIRDFFANLDKVENETRCEALVNEFSTTPVFPELISRIESILTKFGTIRDDASPELYRIRREIASLQASMGSIMRRVIAKAVAEGIVDPDTTAAVRDGRQVIPVSAAMKRRISGIVHDESATGKTAFIEPAEAVEAGNRLRTLQMEERREEIAILTAVTADIRPHADEILDGCNVAGTFDFIRAKALFAIDLDAQMPVLENKSEIDWYHAQHPALKITLRKHDREVVPMNLRLDRRHRFLMISGPNAGGKSVALKTVGCVQYMAQCGLLPTLYSNSHVGIFRNILIDIGDEQSIENDLSTYSSHLRNMKTFLRSADKCTLVLADEMGSGTEPQIGGALAQAILGELEKSGCFGVITTHYHNLKTFADSQPAFVNGAMLYDRQRLQPLYELSIGNAGSSFALEIAQKTGLPTSVIEEAKSIAGSEYVDMDKFLLQLARDRKYWSEKRLQVKKREQQLEALMADYEDKREKLNSRRNEILHEAKEEAQKVLSGANAAIERTIHEIRKAEAEKERTKEVRRQLEEYKKEVERNQVEDDKESKGSKKQKGQRLVANAKTEDKHSFGIGDYVRMSDGGVVGKILSINGSDAEVAFGALRTRTKLSKLKPAKPSKKKDALVFASSSSDGNSRERQLNFNRELDVRGMRADEALQAVMYFIDDAVQFSASKVRILHGTGTGALREAIRNWLRASNVVVDFHDEDVRFGGAGITVVDLE